MRRQLLRFLLDIRPAGQGRCAKLHRFVDLGAFRGDGGGRDCSTSVHIQTSPVGTLQIRRALADVINETTLKDDSLRLIVVGASAGGVGALTSLVRDLPGDLAAAVLVVLHVGAESILPDLLDRAGPLPARHAGKGQSIEPGRIYVAPPGFHLLVHDRHLLLRRGPRENLARPAIDPLFRSAACSFGSRVIGVILTGSLNDGTAGLQAIKRCGGLAVVQDPAEAPFRDMPTSALAHVDVDHCLAVGDMASLLAWLVLEPPGPQVPIPGDIRLEAAIAAQEHAEMSSEDQLGVPAPFTCPECQGPLWEIADSRMLRYRCHTGHAFTAEIMLDAQADETDRILSKLLRSHQQRAELARRLAHKERAERPGLADRFLDRAREHASDAEMVKRLLLRGDGAPREERPEAE
jgi:two-component system, chemotaxis family, protein-glutamate methylesterase/glutaminase